MVFLFSIEKLPKQVYLSFKTASEHVDLIAVFLFVPIEVLQTVSWKLIWEGLTAVGYTISTFENHSHSHYTYGDYFQIALFYEDTSTLKNQRSILVGISFSDEKCFIFDVMFP